MFYSLSWFAVIALLALWSLAAWALHAVAVWTVSNAGAPSGAASGASTVAALVIWGIGSVLLVLLGAGLHLLIALLRRHGGGRSGPNAGPLLAAA